MIIAKTYQRDDVSERDRQHDHFQNCYIFVARRADFRASHVALVIALGCGKSQNFRVYRRVTRRVPNHARDRVGVFCTLQSLILENIVFKRVIVIIK